MFYKPTGFHKRCFFNKITKIFIKDGFSIKMFLFYLFECGPCEASAREPTKRYLGDLRFSSLVAWTAGKATSSCNEIPMDGYNPRQTHLFLAIYRGYFTPLITVRGPPCRKFVTSYPPPRMQSPAPGLRSIFLCGKIWN